VLHADVEHGLGDVDQAGAAPSRRKFAGSSQGPRVVPGPSLTRLRIECRCGVKEHAVRHESTARIPHRGSNDGARPGDAAHLGNRIVRTRHEVQGEKRENPIERAIRIGEGTGIAYAELES
jgi:hypothetical protein